VYAPSVEIDPPEASQVIGTPFTMVPSLSLPLALNA
jgi:hypothetical protein